MKFGSIHYVVKVDYSVFLLRKQRCHCHRRFTYALSGKKKIPTMLSRSWGETCEHCDTTPWW